MKVIDPVKSQFCIRKGEQPNAPRFYYCTTQDVTLGCIILTSTETNQRAYSKAKVNE